MNKQAVALAADSAGTIGGKIFNTNNKLFMLSKYHPVGIMVYGSAEIMGYPWETVIKMYRKFIRRKNFPTLQEQVGDFLEYLVASGLFDKKAEAQYIKDAFELVANDILRQLAQVFPDPKNADEKLVALHFGQILAKSKQESEHDLIECGISEQEKDGILANYKDLSDSLIFNNFKDYGVNQAIHDEIYSVMRNAIFRNPNKYIGSSGLVFSGFGEREFFPTTISFVLSSIIGAKIMKSKQLFDSINTENIAIIRPFAQSDMVNSFVFGIDPFLEQQMRIQIIKMLESIPNIIAEISQEQIQLKDILFPILENVGKSFFEGMKNYMDYNSMYPIMQGVSSLSPDELAAMAETLVNLTSFKRKISANQMETVGGPVDVAVITKGDGFIWMRRKHYFQADKNHHFFRNYFNEEKTDEC